MPCVDFLCSESSKTLFQKDFNEAGLAWIGLTVLASTAGVVNLCFSVTQYAPRHLLQCTKAQD